MILAKNFSSNQAPFYSEPIYLKPKNFADYLSAQQRYCLLLDIDGTLAEFTLDPKDSFIPDSTLTLLQNLQNYGVNIAVVTGRSLIEAKKMLSPLQLPIAATHGLEIDFHTTSSGSVDHEPNTIVTPVNLVELAAIRESAIQSCASIDELSIEHKPYSVALHYRQNPALADIAYNIMAAILVNYPNWQLKQGKYVWELMPKGIDKGSAILTLLNNLQNSNAIYPLFIGDDSTDEAGFAAVQGDRYPASTVLEKKSQTMIGMGIKVGNQPTGAQFYVRDIREVTVLLASFLSFCQKTMSVDK